MHPPPSTHSVTPGCKCKHGRIRTRDGSYISGLCTQGYCACAKRGRACTLECRCCGELCVRPLLAASQSQLSVSPAVSSRVSTDCSASMISTPPVTPPPNAKTNRRLSLDVVESPPLDSHEIDLASQSDEERTLPKIRAPVNPTTKTETPEQSAYETLKRRFVEVCNENDTLRRQKNRLLAIVKGNKVIQERYERGFLQNFSIQHETSECLRQREDIALVDGFLS